MNLVFMNLIFMNLIFTNLIKLNLNAYLIGKRFFLYYIWFECLNQFTKNKSFNNKILNKKTVFVKDVCRHEIH